MKKNVYLMCLLIFSFSLALVGQTPAYMYHNPPTAGSNNLFFHTSNGRMLFIFTQAELAATGMPVGYTIGSLWFRHSSSASTNLTNFQIHLGHTTNVVPDPIFWDNFNVNGRTRVLNEASYTYNAIQSPLNNVTNNWTEIPLTTPFVYNGINNLAVQIRFANSSNIGVLFFADNGGIPITRYHNNRGASTANRTTARPMLGFSEGNVLNNRRLACDAKIFETGGIRLIAVIDDSSNVSEIRLGKANAQGIFEQIASENSNKLKWTNLFPEAGEHAYLVQVFDQNKHLFAQQFKSLFVEEVFRFSIFPNPITPDQKLKISTPMSGELKIEIYDIVGMLIKREKRFLEEQNLFLPINELVAGVYRIRLAIGAQEALLPLVVK